MSSSRKGAAETSEPVRLLRPAGLRSPPLLVGWSVDAGNIGMKLTGYLDRKLGCQPFAEIEPVEFFPLGGVSVTDNLIHFPESKFYACPGADLMVLRSDPPAYQWFKFLDTILDVGVNYGHMKELYTVGGMVSTSAHTAPRQVMAVFNSAEFKATVDRYGPFLESDYRTPPDQRPTLSSFLLWAAGRRNIPAVSLWVPIPFYLLGVGDPRAEKVLLEFFNRRFGLQLDLSDLGEQISRQSEKIGEARGRLPEIDQYITRLESNQVLSAEENEKLVNIIEDTLGGRAA